MQEALLHHIWQYKLAGVTFEGTQKESISVIYPGEYNTNAGPDFFNARIKVNEVELVGNVEIHIKSSDWIKHNHHKDKAYNTIVLHVVYEHDIDITQNQAHNVSVVELNKYIQPKLLDTFKALQQNNSPIPCSAIANSVSKIIWQSWLHRLAIERLNTKVDEIQPLFLYLNNSYEETLYVLLSKYFGLKINSLAFELLAKSTPYNIIKKHLDNVFQLEALLFGQAGMLDEPFEDEYPRALQNEYAFLKAKYNLISIKKEIWKFLRLRPANFPTIRLAQLATLLSKTNSLFNSLLAFEQLSELETLLQTSTHSYWDTHYLFDKLSPLKKKRVGKLAVHHLIINVVIPFLFFYSKSTDEETYRDKALQLLETIPAEENSIVANYQEIGCEIKTALESQAVIHLQKHFCSKKQCLNCSIGSILLKSTAT